MVESFYNAGIDEDSTDVTKITQDQANEINHILENIDNYASSIDGMSKFL